MTELLANQLWFLDPGLDSRWRSDAYQAEPASTGKIQDLNQCFITNISSVPPKFSGFSRVLNAALERGLSLLRNGRQEVAMFMGQYSILLRAVGEYGPGCPDGRGIVG